MGAGKESFSVFLPSVVSVCSAVWWHSCILVRSLFSCSDARRICFLFSARLGFENSGGAGGSDYGVAKFRWAAISVTFFSLGGIQLRDEKKGMLERKKKKK